VIIGVSLFGMGNGMATLVRATALAETYGATFYGSIVGVAAACATGARAIAPVAAAAIYATFGGYEPLFWILVAGSLLAATSAERANHRLSSTRKAT
jgi:MFS family permease